jgi:quercetin dioxygenase-like cupin family protein
MVVSPCVKKSIFYKKHGGASFILRGQYRKKWSTTMNRTYEAFINGHLRLPDRETSFAEIPWSEHAAFAGVALKHLLTARDTDGQFSYHLVRIAPNREIGTHTHSGQLETHEVVDGAGFCVNDGVRLRYAPGTISIFPVGLPHRVCAGEAGLLLFAKFILALC